MTLCMAPIRGITDHIFRTAFAEHFGGFDTAVAPFISSRKDRKIKSAHLKDLLPEYNTALPVVPQILSNSGEDFVYLADHLYDLGYSVTNWNLGCPYPVVTRKHRGAGLLPHADRIAEFLDTAMSRMKGGLSIKIRLGWADTTELMGLLPVLHRYPLAELIVHPRTGIQRYEGTVDLAAFEQVLENTGLPVMYNGDIQTVADFTYLSGRFKAVDRWMIGRGALADPFLAAAIGGSQPEEREKVTRMRNFHDDLMARYTVRLNGPVHLLDRMKGLWRYFILLFETPDKSAGSIFKAKEIAAYQDHVARFFDAGPGIAEKKPTFFQCCPVRFLHEQDGEKKSKK